MTTTHSSAPSGIADSSMSLTAAGRGRFRVVAEGFAGPIFCPHFAHIIPVNRGNTKESAGIRKAAQPYSRKAKRLFPTLAQRNASFSLEKKSIFQ